MVLRNNRGHKLIILVLSVCISTLRNSLQLKDKLSTELCPPCLQTLSTNLPHPSMMSSPTTSPVSSRLIRRWRSQFSLRIVPGKRKSLSHFVLRQDRSIMVLQRGICWIIMQEWCSYWLAYSVLQVCHDSIDCGSATGQRRLWHQWASLQKAVGGGEDRRWRRDREGRLLHPHAVMCREMSSETRWIWKET